MFGKEQKQKEMRKKKKATAKPTVTDTEKFVMPPNIVEDVAYNLFENVYLQAYEEYIKTYGKFTESNCRKYFKLKIDGCIKEVERKIDTVPLDLRKEASDLFFGELKYIVNDFHKVSKFQSPKAIELNIRISIDKHGYSKFFHYQEQSFQTLLRAASIRKSKVDFYIEFELFNAKLGTQLNTSNLKEKPTTNLIWKSKNEIQMRALYDFLIREAMIDKIDFQQFKNHFLGFPQTQKIWWKDERSFLPELLDKLRKYFVYDLYKKKGTCSPSTIAKHFTFSENTDITPHQVSLAKKQMPNSIALRHFKEKVAALLDELEQMVT